MRRINMESGRERKRIACRNPDIEHLPKVLILVFRGVLGASSILSRFSPKNGK